MAKEIVPRLHYCPCDTDPLTVAASVTNADFLDPMLPAPHRQTAVACNLECGQRYNCTNSIQMPPASSGETRKVGWVPLRSI